MRCFVIRGFGEKLDTKGQKIDFEAVDKALIAPALRACQLQGNTTAEVLGAGGIHQDMFQLILQEEFVLCDITVHNPNVFYELGVRHALRKRRTVLIKGRPSADATPFDIAGTRYLAYDVDNPAAALDDLIAVIQATIADDRVTDSPVFLMLPALPEADFNRLAHVPLDFAQEVQLAQARGDKGWLRLLLEDSRKELFACEALRHIGHAQWKLKDYAAAAGTWEQLRLSGEDADANLALANLYERLYKQSGDAGRLELSNQAISRVLDDASSPPAAQAEARALRARNLKTLWRIGFASLGTLEARRERAVDRNAVDAYEAYRDAFRSDLNLFFPGLAALQMGRVLLSLKAEPAFPGLFDGDQRQADRYVQDLIADLADLTCVVRVAVHRAVATLKGDDRTWARISAADLQFLDLLDRPAEQVNAAMVAAYRGAVPAGSFFWDAARGQLELFQQLGLATGTVQAVIDALDGPPAQGVRRKRHLIVFSGHTVDKTGAAQPPTPRLPEKALDAARQQLLAAFERFKAEDVELCVLASAAPGGDILALECCQALAIPTWLCLPMRKEAVAGEVFDQYPDTWRNRFFDLADAHARLPGRTFTLSENAGLPRWLSARSDMTPWSRGNRWMLCQALAWEADRVTLLALWDGNEADPSEGGTAAMVRLARKAGSFAIDVIDTRTLGAV
jgi:hypothetical protein